MSIPPAVTPVKPPRQTQPVPVVLPKSLLITFEEFLEMHDDRNDLELVDGKVVKRMATPYEHETFFGWMYTMTRTYVEDNDLGVVLGSRSAVKIDDYAGRLPDLLFVCTERLAIIESKALYGVPDWVLEIISPGDRPGSLKKLANDYITIGVPEIWFVDLPKAELRILKAAANYEPQTVGDRETVAPDILPGLQLKVEWLLREPRPKVSRVLRDLQS